MRLITTAHLKSFADTKQAGGRFPRLLKQLIINAVDRANRSFEIPSDDAVWRPGVDGVVVCTEPNDYVPIGLSVWECGTDSAIGTKASKEFSKRRRGTLECLEGLGVTQGDATFVFATPRVWKNKARWVRDRIADNVWKDVVAVDGVTLQEWLEDAAPVSLDFANELGYVPDGLLTPEDAWDVWSELTDPPLLETVATAGREKQKGDLLSRLSGPAEVIPIRSSSARESYGFVLAALRSLEGDEREELNGRLIIAEREDAVRGLRNYRNLVVLLKEAREPVSGFLSSRDCHVVVAEGNGGLLPGRAVELDRPTHSIFRDALTTSGFSGEDAEIAARECGLSVTILQRQRAHSSFPPPQWASAASRSLLAALLALRWNRRSESDRVILGQLAGTSYGEFEADLQQYLHVDEPPILLLDDMFVVPAPADSFQLLGRFLGQIHFDRFADAFRNVFSEIDPRVDLPVDEWLHEDLKGEQGPSAWLRTGMAEAMLLVSVRGASAGAMVPRDFATEVVAGLPGLRDDQRLLASLREEFPRLMEAAPGPFFDCLEYLVQEKPTELAGIFVDSDGGFGANLHCGVLWGLEIMAWSPEYLERVTHILVSLSRLDPGGQLTNRPDNSLAMIFSWWLPGTNASTAQRLAIIDSILANDEKIGWRLLESILPQSRGFSTGTHRARWRDFGDLHADSRTGRGRGDYVSGVVDRAIKHANSSATRWRSLLESARMLTPQHRESAVTRLEQVVSALAPEARLDLWRLLRDFLTEQAELDEPDRAFPQDELSRLEEMLTGLSPQDLLLRFGWLFDDWCPRGLRGRPGAEKDSAVEAARQDAIKAILEEQGMDGVVDLARDSRYPGFVARALVEVVDDESRIRELVTQLSDASEDELFFASVASMSAFSKHGASWRQWLVEATASGKWSPSYGGILLSRFPESGDTRQLVEGLGEEVRREYWRKKQIFTIEGTHEDTREQIEALIGAGRAIEVFDRVSHHTSNVSSEVLLELFDRFIDSIAQIRDSDHAEIGVSSHDVKAFLDALRARKDVSQDDVARREFVALPILGWLNASGLTLHRFMADSPEFFVELVCLVYLREGEAPQEDEADPITEQRALSAHRLLETMAHIPGSGDEGIDAEELLTWIRETRRLAKDAGRLDIADQRIGMVLAHSPGDPLDGAWPHRAIRVAVQTTDSNHVETGLRVGRFNLRGTIQKAIFEGGGQERGLADQYREWARASEPWPRMARILKKIADNYDAEARHEDAEAEQRKLDV